MRRNNLSFLGFWLVLIFTGPLASQMPLSAAPAHAGTAAPQRHSLLVLTDIENEPDDTESLVRLMLYTNACD